MACSLMMKRCSQNHNDCAYNECGRVLDVVAVGRDAEYPAGYHEHGYSDHCIDSYVSQSSPGSMVDVWSGECTGELYDHKSRVDGDEAPYQPFDAV